MAHRGRKGDGWPKTRRATTGVRAIDVLALLGEEQKRASRPDVCPQGALCGHPVCTIVWYCVEKMANAELDERRSTGGC